MVTKRTLIITVRLRTLGLVLPGFKDVRKLPRLRRKNSKTAKNKRAYDTLRTGLVRNMIKSKPKKLPADRAAGSVRCGLRSFIATIIYKTRSIGGKCAH